MAIVLEELVYRYSVEADTSGLDDMTEAQDDAGVSAIALGGFIAQMATELVKATAAAAKAAVTFGKDLVFGTAETLDQTAKLAKQYGLTGEEMQKLTFAAEQNGVKMRPLLAITKDLQFRLGEASRGGAKPFVDALTDIGLSVQDLRGLRPQEQIGIIGDALNRVTDDADRNSIATQLFGGQWQKASTLIRQGAEGIKELGDELERNGGLIDDQALESAESFQDEMNRMSKLIDKLKADLFKQLAPAVEMLVKRFREWIRSGVDMEAVGAKVLAFIEGMIEALQAGLSVLEFFYENWRAIVALLAAGGTLAAFSAISAAITAIGTAATTSLGPIGLLAAGVSALIALQRDSLALFDNIGKANAKAGITTKERGSPGFREALDFTEDEQKLLTAITRARAAAENQAAGETTEARAQAAREEVAHLKEQEKAIMDTARARKEADDALASQLAQGPTFDPVLAAESQREADEAAAAAAAAKKAGGGKRKDKAKGKSLEELIAGATGSPGGLLGLDGRGGAAALGGIFITQDNRLTITLPRIEMAIHPGNTGELNTTSGAQLLGENFRDELAGVFTEIRDHYQGAVI